MQVALRNGSTASQLVTEWSGTRAQLQCNYTLRDVAGQKGIPSVADVSRAFGNMTAVNIIVEHLKSIFSYADMELSSEQLCETAMSIMTNYYYLNLAELCLFFVQLKAGARGQVVWGSRINNQAIMVALYDFCRDRKDVIVRRETEEQMQRQQRGFTKIDNAAAAIVKGVDTVRELKEKAKTQIKAFRTLFPSLPKGYTETVLFEAYGGKETAIRAIYGPELKMTTKQASEDLYRRLCDYNVKVNK